MGQLLKEIQSSEIKNDKYWYLLFNARNNLIVSQIFELFRKHEIEPILIKGWAAAQYYPNKERQFADFDLCVSPETFERAAELIATPQAGRFNIDLHKGLRHLDTLSWEDLFANSEILEIENTPVRVLRTEDHLRVLCVHWLTDGGANKIRLWDIYYAIENRSPTFDWDRFLGVVSEKRRKWLLCCLGLTKRYLGLNLENTPVADKVDHIPRWIINAAEKEWEDEVKLRPLDTCWRDRKAFWKQIKKRIPPNPIQATVDLEGEFDDSTRFFYQLGDIFLRLSKSIIKNGRVFIFGK